MNHAAPSPPHASKVRQQRQAQRVRRKRERTTAKNSMVVSLGALVLTGYLIARGRRADTETFRAAHMIAGVALLGTSYWHSTLYQPASGNSAADRRG